jgi:hypothetical protein
VVWCGRRASGSGLVYAQCLNAPLGEDRFGLGDGIGESSVEAADVLLARGGRPRALSSSARVRGCPSPPAGACAGGGWAGGAGAWRGGAWGAPVVGGGASRRGAGVGRASLRRENEILRGGEASERRSRR